MQRDYTRRKGEKSMGRVIMAITNPTPASDRTLTLTLDASELLSALAELRERLPQVLDGSVSVPKLPLELGRFDLGDGAALGTGQIRVLLKPSDGLRHLMAAVLAGDIHGSAVKESSHGGRS
jgi:hypothetical protein